MSNKVNNTGYLDKSNTKHNSYNIIPSSNITMDGVSQKLMAVELDKEGKIIGTKFMKPNNGEYNFPKAQNIMEIPQYKKGGKQKLYTQDDLDAYLDMYMNGGELPKYQTGSQFELADMNNNGMGLGNYLPSYLNNSNIQQNSYEGLGPVAYNPTQNQATPTQKQQTQGQVWDAHSQTYKPSPSKVWGAMSGQYENKQKYGFDLPTDEELEISELNSNTQEINDFTNSLEKPTVDKYGTFLDKDKRKTQLEGEQGAFDAHVKDTINKDLDNPEQRQGIELTNNPNIQFFNQYQGVDIPTAAHTLGTSIESGDTLGTVASSLKLATGLGRNIMGGLGQQRQYKRQQQDYYEKAGEHSPANSYERGGQYQDDLSNYMNMVDPIDPKDKKLTPEQIKELNKRSGVEFTEDSANSLFEQIPDALPPPIIPKLDLGKYKKVDYFDSSYNEITGEYDVTPTKNNPANADLYKENLRYLQKMNPNFKINRRGHDSGYIPRGQRDNFEKGGEYQGDEYRKGLDEDMLTDQQKQLLNAETEAGEYIKDPTTEKVSEIVGNKHSQGGEKMVMKQGEKVLTDHTKLGAKNAKYIKETYDIDIKAKNTYSDVLDKIRSKTGLKKLVQEEEDYIKKLEKLSDKDEVTGSINTKFLEEKLGEVRAKKEPLEKVRQSVFDDLYNIQESNKTQENQKEFEEGGEYSVGEIDPKKGKKVTREEARAKVKSGEWEDLGGGKYIDRGELASTTVSDQNLQSYRQTWDKNKFPTLEEYSKAADKWKKEHPNWNQSSVTNTEGTPDKRYYTEGDLIQIEKRGYPGVNPLDAITTENITFSPNSFIDAGLEIPKQNNEIAQEGDEQDDDTQIEKKGSQKTRTPRNIALLPNQYPMAPNSLEPTIKQNTSYEMFDPSLIDPTIYLENLQRQELQAERRMEGLPPQVRQAALANLEANMARANADTMLKIDAQNINSKNRAEEMNTRIANRQVDANNRDRLMFEGRALTAKSNTDRDYQNYFNKGMEVNLQNYRDIEALNRLNSTHDTQYIPGRGFIKPNAPDFSKYYEMAQQLAKYQQKEKDAEKKEKD